MAAPEVPSGYPLFATRAVVYMNEDTISSVGANSSFLELMGTSDTQITAVIKNVTITPGGRGVDVVNTLGTTQLRDLKRSEMTTVKFTLVHAAGIGTIQNVLEWLWGSAVSVSGSIYRVTGGWKSSAASDRRLQSLWIKSEDEAKAKSWEALINNCLTVDCETTYDAEGHAEQTFTVTCLAADTYVDFDATA